MHRSIVDWEWYDDSNTFRVFLHILIKANYEDKKWRGVLIKRGQLTTTYQQLSDSLELSVMQVRYSIDKLKSTGEISYKSYAKFGLITINNYDKYQFDNTQITHKQHTNSTKTTSKQHDTNGDIMRNVEVDKESDNTQTTHKQHANNANLNTQLTTIKEIKNKRNKEYITPLLSPQGDDKDLFDEFWEVYPKKVSKQVAIKAWKKINPSPELVKKIVNSVEIQSHSEQWRRDNGRFIPYPATWLNNRRWEDEVENKVSEDKTTEHKTSYDLNKIKSRVNDFDNIKF